MREYPFVAHFPTQCMLLRLVCITRKATAVTSIAHLTRLLTLYDVIYCQYVLNSIIYSQTMSIRTLHECIYPTTRTWVRLVSRLVSLRNCVIANTSMLSVCVCVATSTLHRANKHGESIEHMTKHVCMFFIDIGSRNRANVCVCLC